MSRVAQQPRRPHLACRIGSLPDSEGPKIAGVRTKGCDGLKRWHQDGFFCPVCRCHRLRAADRRVQSTRANDRGRHVADADPIGLRFGDRPSGLRNAGGDSNVAAHVDAHIGSVAALADARAHPGSAGLDQPSGRHRIRKVPKDHDLSAPWWARSSTNSRLSSGSSTRSSGSNAIPRTCRRPRTRSTSSGSSPADGESREWTAAVTSGRSRAGGGSSIPSDRRPASPPVELGAPRWREPAPSRSAADRVSQAPRWSCGTERCR